MYILYEALRRFFLLSGRNRKIPIRVFRIPSAVKRILSARFDFDTLDEAIKEEEEEGNGNILLDLPDLPLDCILEKLTPSDLCSMSGVCSSLREKCTSDHLWEEHMKKKWGGVIGDAAYREWRRRLACRRADHGLRHCRAQSKFQLFSGFFDFFGSESELMERKRELRCSLTGNSVMYCYLALENGKFWFPAQVFNRENGHVGFVLSCYDAQLSYGSTTNNFVARYRGRGRSLIEDVVEWGRIRAPTVDTPANVLHVSECLDELKPGDHIEIQWRKNKEFLYGWWYGVVGHLESCFANPFNCQCHTNDIVVLEFKQYRPESRWRKTMINRKERREVGNETDGFYGGVRKLYKEEEIAKWKDLWPKCTLE
ncbi:hypothetical protein OROHE_015941 [Orobanche hederae]